VAMLNLGGGGTRTRVEVRRGKEKDKGGKKRDLGDSQMGPRVIPRKLDLYLETRKVAFERVTAVLTGGGGGV